MDEKTPSKIPFLTCIFVGIIAGCMVIQTYVIVVGAMRTQSAFQSVQKGVQSIPGSNFIPFGNNK